MSDIHPAVEEGDVTHTAFRWEVYSQSFRTCEHKNLHAASASLIKGTGPGLTARVSFYVACADCGEAWDCFSADARGWCDDASSEVVGGHDSRKCTHTHYAD